MTRREEYMTQNNETRRMKSNLMKSVKKLISSQKWEETVLSTQWVIDFEHLSEIIIKHVRKMCVYGYLSGMYSKSHAHKM